VNGYLVFERCRLIIFYLFARRRTFAPACVVDTSQVSLYRYVVRSKEQTILSPPSAAVPQWRTGCSRLFREFQVGIRSPESLLLKNETEEDACYQHNAFNAGAFEAKVKMTEENESEEECELLTTIITRS
jgi:hypothetical protein